MQASPHALYDVVERVLGSSNTTTSHWWNSNEQRGNIKAFKYPKYTKFNQICPIKTISNFCSIGRKYLKQKRY